MENNIRKIIEEKNLKITEVISKAGISKSYLYDVMNCNSIPSLQVARMISKAIGNSLEDVFPDIEM